MKVQLALVCDDARVNEEQKLDIHGVFNDLYAPGFPARHSMVLVLLVEWEHEDAGRYVFKADLLDPTDRPSLTVEGHTDVDPRDPSNPPPRTRLVLPLQDVVFPMAGTYSFQITIKGETHPGPSLYLVEATELPSATIEA